MLKAPHNLIIVSLEYADRIGSIIVPDSAKQYKGNFVGIVKAIGPEYPYDLQVGDKVYYRRHEGFTIRTDEGKFIALRERWVDIKEGKDGGK